MYRKEILLLAAVIFIILNPFFSSGWGRGGNDSWAQTPKEDSAAGAQEKNSAGSPAAGAPSKEILPAKQEGEVEISPEKQQLIGVKKVQVALRPWMRRPEWSCSSTWTWPMINEKRKEGCGAWPTSRKR